MYATERLGGWNESVNETILILRALLLTGTQADRGGVAESWW
jgi:hypothetical protein